MFSPPLSEKPAYATGGTPFSRSLYQTNHSPASWDCWCRLINIIN